MKLTKEELDNHRKALIKCNKEIAEHEDCIQVLHKLHDSILRACCDAGCENDGNAHRPTCSIYKI